MINPAAAQRNQPTLLLNHFGSARRPVRFMVAGVCTLALALLGGGTVPANAAALASVGGASSATMLFPAAQQKTAVAAAQVRAAASGAPVVVEGFSSPTTQTLANPDGTMQYEVSTLPVRVEESGEWIPVDMTLERVGDWFEPSASAAPVRFASGGSDVLAQVQSETGEWITETWPYGALPRPVIDGDTATYSEVLPGVDLKMIATRTGQMSIYEVKTPEAAESAELASLHVVIENAELTTLPNGSLKAELEDGSHLVSGLPLWWDSSDGGTYRAPGGDLPGLPVEHAIDDDRVVMDVEESIDARERGSIEIDFPIFIDPDWSTAANASWYTDKAFPGVSYLNANPLRTGISAPYQSDLFFQFPIAPLSGKIIGSATLNTTMVQTLFCAPDPIQVRTYGNSPGAGFTWNQQIAAGTSWGGVIETKNPGNCGTAPEPVGWNVSSVVPGSVAQGTIRLGITGPGARSRRHFDPSATLIVSYNSRPDAPTAPVFTSPSRECGTSADPAMLGQKNVTVRVNQTDPDAGNVDTNFHLMKASNLSTPVQDKAAGMGAQGAKSVTFTDLAEGETYAWRAWGSDHFLDGVGPSNWCYFTIDTIKPTLPNLTAPATAEYIVGTAVPVSVTGSADVAGYVYWITPDQLTPVAPPVPTEGVVSTAAALPNCDSFVGTTIRRSCANPSGPVVVSVAPVDSLSTLWISAYDRAGNQSTAVGHPLYAGGNSATPATNANIDDGHAWQVTNLTTPLPLTVPDSNPWQSDGGIALEIPISSWTTATDLVDPPFEYPVIKAGSTPNPWDTIMTHGAPMNATASFTWSMWLKPWVQPTMMDQQVAVQSGPGRGRVSMEITVDGKYEFCITGSAAPDDNGRPVSTCAKGGTVVLNSWQMVTGIWDSENKQLRLLIGNSMIPVSTVGHVVGSGDWSASGPMMFAPAPDSFRYYGLIANPSVLPSVIDHYQLSQLHGFLLPFSE